MKLQPHIALNFDGRCEAAFKLYEKALSGQITYIVTWGNTPAARDAPTEWASKIYHVTLKVGETEITGSDQTPDKFEQPKGFSIVLQMDDPAVADRVYDALSENGRIGMPLQETFWAKRFGAFVDQFGIPWTINCE